jgi:hypothetical protein
MECVIEKRISLGQHRTKHLVTLLHSTVDFDILSCPPNLQNLYKPFYGKDGKAELLLGTMAVHCSAVSIGGFFFLFLGPGENESIQYVCQ